MTYGVGQKSIIQMEINDFKHNLAIIKKHDPTTTTVTDPAAKLAGMHECIQVSNEFLAQYKNLCSKCKEIKPSSQEDPLESLFNTLKSFFSWNKPSSPPPMNELDQVENLKKEFSAIKERNETSLKLNGPSLKLINECNRALKSGDSTALWKSLENLKKFDQKNLSEASPEVIKAKEQEILSKLNTLHGAFKPPQELIALKQIERKKQAAQNQLQQTQAALNQIKRTLEQMEGTPKEEQELSYKSEAKFDKLCSSIESSLDWRLRKLDRGEISSTWELLKHKYKGAEKELNNLSGTREDKAIARAKLNSHKFEMIKKLDQACEKLMKAS